MPLGIELTRPKMNTNDELWKIFFVPGTTGTDVWLWRLVKAHVLSHDSCIHQVVIHWYVHLDIHTLKYLYLLSNIIFIM